MNDPQRSRLLDVFKELLIRRCAIITKNARICICLPQLDGYSETFLQAHAKRLSGICLTLHGGYFPTRVDGQRIFPPKTFVQRVKSLIRRQIFRISEDDYKNRVLAQLFRRSRIGVVLAEYGPTGASIMNACGMANVPFVVHFHGYDAHKHDVLDTWLPAYEAMFSKAASCIAVSKMMVEQLVSIGCAKAKIVHNCYGVDIQRFQATQPSENPLQYLAVGRFVEKKKPYLTILAFSKVLAELPAAKLIMVGDGPLLEACRDLARALGCDAHIDFTGVLSHEAVAALMQQSRCFVQHSAVAANGDSEGTPVAILEACATGLPVVATRHAGIMDVVQHEMTGLLVAEKDVDAMAHAMVRVEANPQLADRLGAAARQRMLDHFTMKDSLSRLQDILSTYAAHN